MRRRYEEKFLQGTRKVTQKEVRYVKKKETSK